MTEWYSMEDLYYKINEWHLSLSKTETQFYTLYLDLYS